MAKKPEPPQQMEVGTTLDGEHWVQLLVPELVNEADRFRVKIVRKKFGLVQKQNGSLDSEITRVVNIATDESGPIAGSAVIDQDVPTGLYFYVTRSEFVNPAGKKKSMESDPLFVRVGC